MRILFPCFGHPDDLPLGRVSRTSRTDISLDFWIGFLFAARAWDGVTGSELITCETKVYFPPLLGAVVRLVHVNNRARQMDVAKHAVCHTSI